MSKVRVLQIAAIVAISLAISPAENAFGSNELSTYPKATSVTVTSEQTGLLGGPWPPLFEALTQPRRHRPVAAQPGPLADRRPPARAEVDRVHADCVSGNRFGVAAAHRWLCRLGLRVRQGARVVPDPLLVDADESGPCRHPGAAGANFVGEGNWGHG